MNRAKFLSTMRLWAVCVLVLSVFCLAGNIQRAYAETYTTMDSSGNLITSDSLESAIETARITGRPIALDPGHSDGMSGRDPGAIGPSGLREGDVAWNTAMSTKYYLEKWGIKVVVVRGQNEDPTLKERVQRAVDAKCCAIVSMHYNSAGPNAVGSMVLTPRNIRYNNDLYTAGQKLAKAINGELNKRAGITNRWDSAPTKGYGGGDTYDTGEESDYFGIIRYARRNGILGVIIEHEFISNPSMEAKLSNSAFIDRIGYADAWGIWDHFYASKTWWSMSRVDAWSGSDGQITMRPHLVGVGSGMTYSYYYKISGGSWVTLAENTTNTSYSFTPLSGGTYTLYITAKSSDGTSVSRQIEYKAGTIHQSPGWHKTDNGWMYFNSNGEAYSSCWFKDSDGWHFFNAAGIAARGWAYTTNNDIFYFDPSQEHHPALLGEVTLNGGRHYYFDESRGLVQDRWVKLPGGNWVYASKEGAFISGWHYIGSDIFYFDTGDPTHPALFGEVVLNGGRHYYFDEHSGLAQDRWVKLPNGNWVYASKEGAFISGWHYIGGNKIFYFDMEDPTHPALFGEVTLNGGRHYWFDENQGMASNQWVTLANGKRVWATAEGSLAESDAKDAKLITDAPSGDTEKPDDNNTPDKPSDDPSDKPSDKPSEVTWSTETTILGEASLSKDALVADLKAGLAARGISYPKELAEKSAATPEEFVDQLWDAATAEGVRPEVLYAQAMLETGYLQFNGDVSAGQCNFGGMGATGNGVPGDSYKNVHEGLLAQAQHLRVYTGNTPLTSIVDKRFGDWLLNRQKANPATTIGKLVGSWAMSPTYADQIVSILNRL
ncbi:N-acetylmuramoyl-L-alanine amidase [Lancefieldella rimae]|uniref:N-acetylmuramoyl-L-alanine amidase n=2 Tax=Lancefieldella rimae TaxID=1383 RepID=UPI0028EB03A4|nr:N-acetylmuramoyl-L-alanine amidase [Lancefieldella rimae]